MSIPIQPPELKVSKEYPFENDCLKRWEPAEVLTSLIQGIEGPCVLSVDAPWGAGKTTFLRMWAQHLRNEGFPVVAFNAWETDFTDIPFVALSSELTDSLREEYKTAKLPVGNINSIVKEAKKILPGMIPAVAQIVIENISPVKIPVQKIIEQVQDTYAKKKLSKYLEERGAVEDFRTALENASKALSEKHAGRPLVVVIDELDRCRPTYAVEFLETAKHLFAVDNIVFVLAVNREQMAHSVKALYGNDFDAQKYLRRFFDLDFTLPSPDRSVFIRASLNAINIDDYFKQTNDEDSKQGREVVENLLCAFFQEYGISLRDIQQAVHRIGLILSSLSPLYEPFKFTVGTVAALILRTINPDLYYQFIDPGVSDVSDEKVLNDIFSRPGLQSLRQEHAGCMFEAAIILGAQDMRGITSGNQGEQHSSLWQRYLNIVESREKNGFTSNDIQHAEGVIRGIRAFRFLSPGQASMGFKQAVARIELFSPELIDQKSTDHS